MHDIIILTATNALFERKNIIVKKLAEADRQYSICDH